MMTFLLLCVLTGCGANESNAPATRALEAYATLTGFSGAAQVTADYGDKVYQYEMEVSGDLDSGSLRVTAPESIAGTGYSWSEGGGSVSYEEITLETGPLSPDGLSPTDAMPLVLTAMTTGRQLSWCEEKLAGEETLRLELANPSYSEGVSSVLVWLSTEDYALRRCEITWEGRTVITCSFTRFSFTTNIQESEG